MSTNFRPVWSGHINTLNAIYKQPNEYRKHDMIKEPGQDSLQWVTMSWSTAGLGPDKAPTPGKDRSR